MKNILTFLLTSFLIFNASSQTNTLLFVSAEKCYLEASTNLIIHQKDTFFELSIKKGIHLHNDADRSIFNYVLPDSAKDGKYILLFKNSKPALKLTYKNGKLNGTQFLYYFHGTIRSETFYKKGKLHGTQYFYNIDSRSLSSIKNYDNGVKHGVFISFFSSGHPSTIEFYNKGKIQRKQFKWGENGKHNHSQIKN